MDSNLRPADYKSAALPTELLGHATISTFSWITIYNERTPALKNGAQI